MGPGLSSFPPAPGSPASHPQSQALGSVPQLRGDTSTSHWWQGDRRSRPFHLGACGGQPDAGAVRRRSQETGGAGLAGGSGVLRSSFPFPYHPQAKPSCTAFAGGPRTPPDLLLACPLPKQPSWTLLPREDTALACRCHTRPESSRDSRESCWASQVQMQVTCLLRLQQPWH